MTFLDFLFPRWSARRRIRKALGVATDREVVEIALGYRCRTCKHRPGLWTPADQGGEWCPTCRNWTLDPGKGQP